MKVQSEESGESALTDYRGTYTIKVKDNGKLIFSKKGFADKTIEAVSYTHLDVYKRQLSMLLSVSTVRLFM